MDSTKLSNHFKLSGFLHIDKYPDNKPTLQVVANLTCGCLMLLEPARQEVGPIIINSGFRNSRVNTLVGALQLTPPLRPNRLLQVTDSTLAS